MDSEYHLSVPNSNPSSAFSHYEITGETLCERLMNFTLVGVYSESSGKTGKHEVTAGWTHLEPLKALLVDINGPIPEEAESVG